MVRIMFIQALVGLYWKLSLWVSWCEDFIQAMVGLQGTLWSRLSWCEAIDTSNGRAALKLGPGVRPLGVLNLFIQAVVELHWILVSRLSL